MAEYNAFTRTRSATAARCVGGEALQPTTTATTVRVRDGQTMTTDGPFAETKEALGGFYLVEAADLDEAHRVRGDDPGRAARLDRGPADLVDFGGGARDGRRRDAVS